MNPSATPDIQKAMGTLSAMRHRRPMKNQVTVILGALTGGTSPRGLRLEGSALARRHGVSAGVGQALTKDPGAGVPAAFAQTWPEIEWPVAAPLRMGKM